MQLTIKELEAIVNTLPIGLYCGRRIPVTVDENAETSYYIPLTDKIVISLPIINQGLKNVQPSEDYTEEQAIRAMLYHEVSHAFLTPDDKPYSFNQNPQYNIFEDERIETLCQGYYLDTNFKQNLFYICGGMDSLKAPQSAMEAFFQTVRYRFGKPEHVERVEQIINHYKDLNKIDGVAWCYWDDVDNLYREIAKDFNEENNSGDGDNNSSDSGDEQGNGTNAGMMIDVKELAEKITQLIEAEAQSGTLEEEDGAAGESEGQDSDKKGGAGAGKGISLAEIAQRLSNQYHNQSVRTALEAIFASFNKKNNTGNGMTAYSGVLNPRNVARKDYRYFDKKCSINGNNKYGTCHLNLFIDDSGSFCCCSHAVNQVLYELNEISKKNKNFTFDVIKCSDGMYETTKDTMEIEAGGGTSLDFEETKKIFKKYQKRNTLCHNIVLYDGHCSCRGGNSFTGILDTHNTTMILEDGNSYQVEECKNAKIIFENDKYPEKLIENVLRVLSRAFA